jgi:ubiquinone/menaquinone biosynthesis C-methylase UbiE
MAQDYRKDMRNATWEAVYARQMERAELADGWLDALELRPGSRVLDVGAGPGYFSLRAAARVGPTGRVIAVDRSAEALAILATKQEEQVVPQITRVVADATTMDPPGERVDAALITMMLHHADDPAGLLHNVGRCLPAGALAVVAEFDPAGPGRVGAPRTERLAPGTVRAWLEAAGFVVLSQRSQSPEHYLLVARKERPAS